VIIKDHKRAGEKISRKRHHPQIFEHMTPLAQEDSYGGSDDHQPYFKVTKFSGDKDPE
jgi:hypothetical protein